MKEAAQPLPEQANKLFPLSPSFLRALLESIAR